MDHFAGLDVSVKATSVCIVDDTGKFVREVRWRVKQEFLLRMLAATPRGTLVLALHELGQRLLHALA